MTLQATVLVENSVYGRLGTLSEHGWSVWIETDAGNYLYDTGQGLTLRQNARALEIDYAVADAVLLSHHHVDHTGGLLEAVTTIARRQSHSVPVYAHPDLFKDSYASHNDRLTYIGLPHTRGALDTAGADFRLDAGWREVAEGVFMTGEVPRRTAYEQPDKAMRHRDAQGEVVLDPVRDDQTVVIPTPAGLCVVLGCSHAGLINILTYITERTGESRFHTVIGGTHLGPADEEMVAGTIAALGEFDIQRIGVSHCTGPKVAARMAQAFGERFFFCSVGTKITIE